MRNGKKMKYKINGTCFYTVYFRKSRLISSFSAFSTFLLTMGVTAGVLLRFGPESLTFIYDKWIGFVTASFLMSVIQSIYCYASSFFGDKLLALGGNSGNFIYDVGRHMGPTVISPLTHVIVLHRP